MGIHQPEQAVFRAVLPDDADRGPSVIRVTVPSGTQASATGPLGLGYLDPGDDPRNTTAAPGVRACGDERSSDP